MAYALLGNIDAATVFADRDALIEHAARVAPAGIACEFGVYTGSTLRLIANIRKKPIFGFDSFEGLPEEWTFGSTTYPPGKFACKVPDMPISVQLVKGLFSQTIPDWLQSTSGPVQLLHIDCDLYSSTKDVLTLLGDRMQVGSVIVFDELCDFDGKYSNWRDGEWRALMEWIKSGRKVQPIGRTSASQVAFVVKE